MLTLITFFLQFSVCIFEYSNIKREVTEWWKQIFLGAIFGMYNKAQPYEHKHCYYYFLAVLNMLPWLCQYKRGIIVWWQTIKINYYWRDLLMSKGRQLHCIMMIGTKYYLQIIMCCTCSLFIAFFIVMPFDLYFPFVYSRLHKLMWVHNIFQQIGIISYVPHGLTVPALLTVPVVSHLWKIR